LYIRSQYEDKDIRFFVNFANTKVRDAYVQLAFRNDFRNINVVRSFVNGRRGLIALNGWEIVSSTHKTNYPWAREQITFRKKQGDKNIVGNIYLGQQNGRAFYIVTHYPAEFGDGFAPRANIILQYLKVGR
jgi:hypothetical protein